MASGKNYVFKIDSGGFKKYMNAILFNFPNFKKKLLINLGNRLIAKVKSYTPVDTGLLRRSWFLGNPVVTNNTAEIEIKNNAKYAAAVEFGSKHKNGGFTPGRIMLKQGMAEMEVQTPKIMEDEIQKFVDSQK